MTSLSHVPTSELSLSSSSLVFSSISFTGFTVPQTFAYYLHHRFISKKENLKTRVHIFAKIKNTDRWKRKKIILSYFFTEIPNFS